MVMSILLRMASAVELKIALAKTVTIRMTRVTVITRVAAMESQTLRVKLEVPYLRMRLALRNLWTLLFLTRVLRLSLVSVREGWRSE